MKMNSNDVGKIRIFLLQYIEYLRSTGRQSDSYKADTVEDLLTRL